jgi:hypothetical protein
MLDLTEDQTRLLKLLHDHAEIVADRGLNMSRDSMHATELHMVLTSAIKCIEDLSRWRTALVEAAIVDWSISNENMDDPKKMLNDIVVNNMRQALDPSISGDAVKLIQQGREALDAELEPHPCVKCGEPCRCGHRRPCIGCYAHESP